jgi:hypothetical protein
MQLADALIPEGEGLATTWPALGNTFQAGLMFSQLEMVSLTCPATGVLKITRKSKPTVLQHTFITDEGFFISRRLDDMQSKLKIWNKAFKARTMEHLQHYRAAKGDNKQIDKKLDFQHLIKYIYTLD